MGTYVSPTDEHREATIGRNQTRPITGPSSADDHSSTPHLIASTTDPSITPSAGGALKSTVATLRPGVSQCCLVWFNRRSRARFPAQTPPKR